MKHDYYHKIITSLQKLKEMYPEYTMGRHLTTILDDIDTWDVSDKDLSESIDKYAKSLALDTHHPDREIDKIIDEGLHLDRFKLYEDPDPIIED